VCIKAESGQRPWPKHVLNKCQCTWVDVEIQHKARSPAAADAWTVPGQSVTVLAWDAVPAVG